MFHPKEVTGVKAGERSRRLISEQTHLYTKHILR